MKSTTTYRELFAFGLVQGPQKQLFPENVMVHIKWKGGNSRTTCRERYASVVISGAHKQLVPGRCHVAYQTEGREELNNMKGNLCLCGGARGTKDNHFLKRCYVHYCGE